MGKLEKKLRREWKVKEMIVHSREEEDEEEDRGFSELSILYFCLFIVFSNIFESFNSFSAVGFLVTGYVVHLNQIMSQAD